MKLLNLGCGSNYHRKWINIDFNSSSSDVISCNLLNGIPINDNCIDVVYHSHLLEHFPKKAGYSFVKECFRVLNKDGILRIAVPDLEIIVREYLQNFELALKGNKEAKHNYEWIMLELFDQTVRNETGGEMKNYLYQPNMPNEKYVFDRIGIEGKIIREEYLRKKNVKSKFETNKKRFSFFSFFKKSIRRFRKLFKRNSNLTTQQKEFLKIGQFRLGGEIHQWMYDRYSLSELLIEIGFSEIKFFNAFESNIEDWESYQLDVIKGEVRKPDSIFVEARKR